MNSTEDPKKPEIERPTFVEQDEPEDVDDDVDDEVNELEDEIEAEISKDE